MRVPISAWAALVNEMEDIEDTFAQLCVGEDLNFRVHLGRNIYLSMNSGVLCVDMRTYYTDKNGDLKPGQPGISFKLSEFQELLRIVDEINERISDDSEPSSDQDTPDIAELTTHKTISNVTAAPKPPKLSLR